MCGILLLATTGRGSEDNADQYDETQVADSLPSWWQGMTEVCSNRGPHSVSSTVIESQAGRIHLVSSVLSLRGPSVTSQPIASIKGEFTLAWNGQIYMIQTEGSHDPQSSQVAREALESGENDGIVLVRWLETALGLEGESTNTTAARREAFEYVLPSILDSAIEGEWAFALVDHRTGDVYYGRDALGRRSLLVEPSSSQGPTQLLLASTASHEALNSDVRFEEVGCGSLWVWKPSPLSSRNSMFGSRALQRPLLKELQSSQAHDHRDGAYPEPSASERQEALDLLHDALTSSVRHRVDPIDGQAGRDLSLSGRSVSSGPAPVAILFSGGLDSALLAWYAHLSIPIEYSIDLLNVAFENPRVLQAAVAERNDNLDGRKRYNSSEMAPSQDSLYSTPDRLLSLQTVSQLRTLSIGRQWNLVEINVSYEEYQSAREDILAHMHPCESVMDLSLASVLWFASRGQGHVVQQGETRHQYRTEARVYISGLGADELCGGYSRHRKAFEGRGTTIVSDQEPSSGSASRSWAALAQEMQMDLDRLPTRNLGRDDRILSSHGREGRYPFLCSRIVTLLASLPLRLKCELGLDHGVGDKLLLRQLAKRHGLQAVSVEKKRAMQFGARSAKMEVGQGKLKGHMRLNNSNQNQGAGVSPLGPVLNDPPAPKEVFTTLCYYLEAPCPGHDFPEEAHLLPKALQTQHRGVTRSSNMSCGPPHQLFEHIPLLQRHLDRLATSSKEMARVFPAEWGRMEGHAPSELAVRVLRSLQDALGRFEEELKSDDASAAKSEETKKQRRRVRISLDGKGQIQTVVAKMEPWSPPVASALMPLPAVRLDVQPTGLDVLPQGASGESQTRVRLLQRRALYVHKTSAREFYDAARERVGATLGPPLSVGSADSCFDVLMWTRSSQGKRLLTESSIANVLVEIPGEEQSQEGLQGEAGPSPLPRWFTPRLTLQDTAASEEKIAFLPGLMRSYLLERGLVQEADLSVEDVLEGGVDGRRRRIWLCNALRGVWEVRLDDAGWPP